MNAEQYLNESFKVFYRCIDLLVGFELIFLDMVDFVLTTRRKVSQLYEEQLHFNALMYANDSRGQAKQK